MMILLIKFDTTLILISLSIYTACYWILKIPKYNHMHHDSPLSKSVNSLWDQLKSQNLNDYLKSSDTKELISLKNNTYAFDA